MTHYENYKKIHDYLLENGQQELAGHLDGMKEEMSETGSLLLEVDDTPLTEGETPPPTQLKTRGDGLDTKENE